jgi:hypothetical protein
MSKRVRRRRRERPAETPAFITPPGLEHYRFVARDDDGRSFAVWRDDRVVVGSYSGCDLGELTARYVEEERKERDAAAAARSGDPLAPCRLGWHRTAQGHWFRYASGTSDRLWIYRVGTAPSDYLCTTIWSYGHPPFRCEVCRRAVDKDHPKLEGDGAKSAG